MSRSIRVAIETLGCKLNQAESESLSRQFAAAGYTIASPEECDVYIINTCSVTHIADRKSRHLLRMVRSHNPRALLVATGCYTQASPEELKNSGVDLIYSNKDKAQLLHLLGNSGKLVKSRENGNTVNAVKSRTRSFIKIQDGCSCYCSYCVVPLVRGQEVSLPVAEVLSAIKQRLADGYREIVLTGVRVGAYENSELDLRGLLGKILTETDVLRLRLSSLQPDEITTDLLDLWRDMRLCRHFHLSLQSGCDAVLSRMKRRYSSQEYHNAVNILRSLISDVAITTDIIVGFPGETEQEFEESYQFCRDLSFARIHVFPYSARSGTAAAKMTPSVLPVVKKERLNRMLALAKESAEHYANRFIGCTMPVLWEQKEDEKWSGLTDNYIKVYVRSRQDLTNLIMSAKLNAINKDGVWGDLVYALAH